MNSRKSSGIFVALSVAVLGILTAWGSAWAMLIVSAVMLGLGAAVLGGRLLRGAALVSAGAVPYRIVPKVLRVLESSAR